MWKTTVKDFFLDLFFPKSCFSCQKEGEYLCQDCLHTIDVLESSFCLCQVPQRLPIPGKCMKCQSKKLDGLYFASSSKNILVRKLIHNFKHDPYIKGLSTSLASLIITHFKLIKASFNPADFIIIPIPLTKKKLKFQGFSQSEELAKELSKYLQMPIISGCLIKIKETPPQTELFAGKRTENIKGVFTVKNNKKIKDKKILLVDDFYTTGSVMEEAAEILEKSGTKEIWGVTVVREE